MTDDSTQRIDVEDAVTDVFRRHLGITDVDLEANFFELGGHSLMAAAIVHDLSERVGVELDLAAFFGQPTVIGIINDVSAQVEADEAERGGEVEL